MFSLFNFQLNEIQLQKLLHQTNERFSLYLF